MKLGYLATPWRRIIRYFALASLLLGIFLVIAFPPLINATGSLIQVSRVDGVIDPITAGFVERVIDQGNERQAELIVIEMDTPGGLDQSMRQIIKAILASDVPVAVFVSPSGARAASAGTFILMSADVAAMAPGTNVGAASPVALGGGADETSLKKAKNDAVAFIRSIAEQRGRNADWAEDAVRDAVSATATEAKDKNVIDLVAQDLPALLGELDGFEVGDKTLSTKGLPIERADMGWQEDLLHTLANPNLAFILLLIGIYGIIFELSNPGAILPGALGAIALILAFFALQTLPINLAGLFLIILGVVLFILEVSVVSHGMLSIGGIIALFLGGLMLFNVPGNFQRISLGVLIPAVLVTAAFFIFVVGYGLRAQTRKLTIGAGHLQGAIGTARTPLDPTGQIFVYGSLWEAVSDEPVAEGDRVEVYDLEGIILKVRPTKEESHAV